MHKLKVNIRITTRQINQDGRLNYCGKVNQGIMINCGVMISQGITSSDFYRVHYPKVSIMYIIPSSNMYICSAPLVLVSLPASCVNHECPLPKVV